LIAADADAAGGEDDRRLARRVLDGDQEAFTLLVRRHQRQVAAMAGRFFRRRETVEDVTQEVFLKAYQALPSFRGDVPLAHWLARITTNTCYDRLRAQRRTPEVVVAGTGESSAEFWDRLAADDAADGDAFWRREDARLTAEALLARLSPADRLVLTLLVLQELDVTEVARLTGWSRVNVKVRALRARRRMRRLLEQGPPRRAGGVR
jgi:RNA polymerase sigma-70 factor (ECF subfamily)